VCSHPMGAVRRSTGDPLPRKNEPIATTSGKSLSGRTGTMTMLSSPTEHGAGQSPVPHTQGRHQLHPYPSLHPVVPVRPSFSASTNQWRQF
jgi:hypothetical protein